jgi:hypothetical protein
LFDVQDSLPEDQKDP